jgi:hypothetical protein
MPRPRLFSAASFHGKTLAVVGSRNIAGTGLKQAESQNRISRRDLPELVISHASQADNPYKPCHG